MARKPNPRKIILPFGTGAIPDPKDERDYSYDMVASAAPVVIDWDKGFDIRNFIGGDINFKNQNQSSSCVGQGTSYYVWVKQIIEMMKKYSMDLDQLRISYPEEIDDASAKAIYSQISLGPGAGAYIRDGVKLLCEWGSVDNDIVPSNKPDGSSDEDFMRDKSWKTKEMDELAKIFQGKDYRVINACQNMDLFAQAILENHGVVGGVEGANNGTWMSERPQPPIGERSEWAHCLYFGAFGKDENGKFIAFPNSWGNILGKTWFKGAPVGYGWQKIYINYFVDGGRWLFNPWTYTDSINPNKDMANTNVKVIKDSNSPAVGFWCPANNPDGMTAMARNFGIDIPKKADDSIDWDKLIQGTLTLE